MKVHSFLKLALFTIFIYCKPSVVDYIKKAKKALSQEDARLAGFYFQKAYETSLDKSFFILDRQESFSDLEVSYDHHHLAAIRNLDKDSEFFYYDLKNREEIKRDLDGNIKAVDISSRGSYLTFLISFMNKADQEECFIQIWDRKRDRFIKTVKNIFCSSKPATSELGEVLFVQDSQIKIIYLSEEKTNDERISVAKIPKSLVPKEASMAWFTFSSEDHPFMTYGIAGSYHLYDLSNRSLKLISKRGSIYKIYFIDAQPYPGIITGGAGKYQINFFRKGRYENVVQRRSMGAWKGIAFIDQNSFYFIESDRLHSHRNREEALFFLAQEVFVGPKGEAVFLSPLGTPMIFDGPAINKLSQTIFNKTLDLNELN